MKVKRVIVIGAGFGGLAVANQLKRRREFEVLLIDRNNYHTFTPLLYQVATAALDPSEIAYPIRGIFRRSARVSFLLGEVTNVLTAEQVVEVSAMGRTYRERYDYLVIAAGSVTNTYGKADLSRFSFGLKDLEDSVTLRNHILTLFERAAWSTNSREREALTTLVVVGGGPTGLETAGALYELYNHVLSKEYNRVNAIKARVVLVEASNRLLAPYPERLQTAAHRQLEGLGVEVILGNKVTQVTEDAVYLENGEVIYTYTLVWAAGVKGAGIAEQLGVPLQSGSRIPVTPTLAVKGLDQVYAIGDIAYLETESGEPYAQMIPVAQQQGKQAAKNIVHHLNGAEQKDFHYFDKGIMATIGRRRAVAWPFYRVQLTGYFAWIAWLALHLVTLMGFRNRVNVFINWVWNYFTYDRSVRLILGHNAKPIGDTAEIDEPEQPEIEQVRS